MQRCDHCFSAFPAPGTKGAPRPLTCPECAACLYCDDGCRREALPDHRHECLYLRQKVSRRKRCTCASFINVNVSP